MTQTPTHPLVPVSQEMASLRIINEVSQTLHHAHDLPQIAGQSVEALRKYSQSPMVVFYILEPGNQHLNLLEQYGFSEETLRAGRRLPLEGSLSGLAITTRELLLFSEDICTDSRIEPNVQRALAAAGMQCAILIPLKHENTSLGVVNLIFNHKVSLNDIQSETLSSIGKTIGLAIANVRHIAQLNAEIAEREKTEQEIRALNQTLENRVNERTAELEKRSQELETALNELESITYTISHDLRAPLRAVNGFARILQLDYGHLLDEQGHSHLERMRSAAQQMGELIDSLLTLSRLTHRDIRPTEVDLSKIARQVTDRLRASEPNRRVEIVIAKNIFAHADPSLMQNVMEHLLANAWKFSRPNQSSRIEFGALICDDRPTYFVRDNGVGFDMQHAKKLFGTFQRLHHVDDFPGIGIGLAVIHRILQRHNGRIWAESEPGQGATFYFSLGAVK